MQETLFNAHGLDETRIKRAFGWIVTFRDFPVGSWQTVDGDSMMSQALTLFTKGRAEFYLDGERRKDRVPGILSSEYDIVGEGGTFTLRYVEPTTRVCIPAKINKNRKPTVKKHLLTEGEELQFTSGQKCLVCLGQITITDRIFEEEKTFSVRQPAAGKALVTTILLEFLD